MMRPDDSQYAGNAIASAASDSFVAIRDSAYSVEQALTRPSWLYRPNLSIDGNQWCALFGDNLQDGVAGFGDSPAAAYADFDRQWYVRLPAAEGKSDGKEAARAQLAECAAGPWSNPGDGATEPGLYLVQWVDHPEAQIYRELLGPAGWDHYSRPVSVTSASPVRWARIRRSEGKL